MKRLLAIFALLFATSALAVDNVQSCTGNSCSVKLSPRSSDGVATPAVSVDGNGTVTLGPPATGNYTGRPHLVSGALYGGNVTTNDASGELVIGVNSKVGGNTAQANRTTTGTGWPLEFWRSREQSWL